MTGRPPPTSGYVDTHAHLDDPAFDTDRNTVIKSALSVGVQTILNVGYLPDRWQSTLQLSAEYPSVQPTIGIHPRHANVCTDESLSELKAILRRGAVRAVGEIGLDFFRDGPNKRSQVAAFNAQLHLAHELGLPIIIHQRAAESDLINVLSSYAQLPPVVLHSFEGTNKLAAFARDREYYVGVGGLATKAQAESLRDVLRRLPVTSVVLETDSPYLSPAGSKQRRNEPANLPLIAERLAPLWGLTVEEFATQTSANAAKLFKPKALPVKALEGGGP